MPKLKHDILNDIVMDDEFKEIVERHKERELTDVEKDLKIQADKVIYVINRTIAKLTMVAYLPYFLEDDAAVLRQHLKPIEVYFIRDVLANFSGCNYGHSCSSLLEDYARVLEYTKLKYANFGESATSLEEVTYGVDPYVSNLIDIIFYNNCLRDVFHTKRYGKVDRGIMKVVKAMTDFKEMAKIRLYITGEDEAELDKELRESYNTNTLLKISIEELKVVLEKQRKDMGEQLDKKVGVFEMYNRKMEKIKHDFHVQFEKIIALSEEQMMEKSVESEAKQADLAEEAKRITAQYNSLLELNLKSEKQGRTRRYKIETQLQNWLTKFDQDMGDRQAEYEALEKEFYDEKAQMEELQVMYEQQGKEYKILMKEKTQEQDRIDNELADEFLLHHAARLIQRTWRAYWQRKLDRKKAKKGKKGKGGKKKPEDALPAYPSYNTAALETKFDAAIFEDMKDTGGFKQQAAITLD